MMIRSFLAACGLGLTLAGPGALSAWAADPGQAKQPPQAGTKSANNQAPTSQAPTKPPPKAPPTKESARVAAAQPKVITTPSLYLHSSTAAAVAPKTITTDRLYLATATSGGAGGPTRSTVITTERLYLNGTSSKGK